MKQWSLCALAAVLLALLCACSGLGRDAAAKGAAPTPADVILETPSPSASPDTSMAETPALELEETMQKILLSVGENELTATLADNPSAAAFAELLKKGPLTVAMEDYANFEKVGPIGTTLPRTDTEITTEPGDIILYLGTNITIYYDHNTWNFTRLGHIDEIAQEELKTVLGAGNVTVTFSLKE